MIKKINRLKNSNCIIFDIDGVLIDVRKSYNSAIIKTVKYFLKKVIILNMKIDEEQLFSLIYGLRHTGGFNNDVDTSYAIILLLCYYYEFLKYKKIDLHGTLDQIIKKLDDKGINSLEEILFKLSKHNKLINDQLLRVKNILNYPAPVGQSIIATIFDEFFYGPKMFFKRYNILPKYYFRTPLIDHDKIIIKKSTIETLSKKVDGKIGIISGRSRLAAEYSLGKFLDYFNNDLCVFLEDEKREYAKPNTFAIEKILTKVNDVQQIMYVGDAIEDLIMTRKAQEIYKLKFLFCGIYGCSINPTKLIKNFKLRESEIIVKDVNQLPKILNKV